METDKVRNFIEENSKEVVTAEGAFCVGYFLTAEFMDGNGEYYTWTVFDESVPPWRIEGLVNYTLQKELYPEEEDEDA